MKPRFRRKRPLVRSGRTTRATKAELAALAKKRRHDHKPGGNGAAGDKGDDA